MKKIRFSKVVGTGNDFILIDTRKTSVPGSLAQLASTWCDRKQGIGADGLLVVGDSKKADARMRIFNSDGSEAEMCGNGLRCVGWYLHATDHGKKTISVQTGAGVMDTHITGKERVRIFMTPPKQFRLGLEVSVAGKRYPLHAVNTGVPHAILLVSDLARVDLNALGPAIRHHRLFQPAGTNVNLVRIQSSHQLTIRTYERGVEDETLACGTGSVAAAVIGTALGRLKPPIQITTAGGEKLTVGFRQGREPWQGLYLEGPARILFQGELNA